MHLTQGLRLAVLACGVALLARCGVPIRTVEVGPEATYDSMNVNALAGGKLGADTLLVLNRFDLEGAFADDPLAAIRKLHAIAVAQPSREVLFSLAELCYAAGEGDDRRDCYLGAAVYAWHYLLGADSPAPPNPFDRRFRVACDVYNYGLLKALRSPDGERFVLSEGTLPLPVGHLSIDLTRPTFPWPVTLFDEFIPSDNLKVIGFSSRRRDAGLGVPLIAVRDSAQGDEALAKNMAPRSSLPATAFLRVEGKLADLERGTAASLELYSAFDVRSIEAGGQRVTLECDLTAPLAHQLQRSRAWDFELGAFFSGDEWTDMTGLYLLQPWQRGKIPVVFVHGTASSPARWAEMFNQLYGDADLRGAFQFWFFSYVTGDPILYSASRLRDALTDLVRTLDPEGSDPSLRGVVVVGHSQGGLLARLVASSSGDVFWRNIEASGLKLDAMPRDDRAFVERLARFEPQPDVRRVVYLATPHHGSFVAGGFIGGFTRRLISTPSHVLGRFKGLLSSPESMEWVEGKLPTSVDNMEPDHPFVLALNSMNPSPDVRFHSIIAVDGDGAPEGLDDGVVAWKSAHVEPVDSELVVRSGHSCQASAPAIEEVRRILLLHLRESKPAADPAKR